MASPTIHRIAELNDKFRRGDPSVPGHRFVTAGLMHLLNQLHIAIETLIQKVAQFDDFNDHNDSHGEHDFGQFEFLGHQLFWKLDYYVVEYNMGSDDPADLSKTHRLLTVMLAHEW